MKSAEPARCLVLACGNPLRGDDGVGPWLCDWAAERFRDAAGLRTIVRQQWGPETALEIAEAEAVLFLDCSIEGEAGDVRLSEVQAAVGGFVPTNHHMDAAALLALAQELYGRAPRRAVCLTVTGAEIGVSEEFSAVMVEAVPKACALLESTVLDMLGRGVPAKARL